MTEAFDGTAPNLVHSRDLAVLVGILAELEGELMASEVPRHLADRLRERFVRLGLLGPEASERDLRQAVNDLNHRLRYGLGEYPELPPQLPVPD
ncbi:hypothetical protein [Micromonospora vulcania]|uniref:Uncharacterized protein n=1 Tax=Micromonospora vulcania TaxID=1441873 RepID=A0ABW1H0F8_9ACTN